MKISTQISEELILTLQTEFNQLSNIEISDHFRNVTKMVEIGSNRRSALPKNKEDSKND